MSTDPTVVPTDVASEGSGFGEDDRKKTRRGAILSVLGGIVLAGVRAMGFVLRAIFGGEMWGLYAIAWSLIELLAFFLVGGFNDAVVIFASRVRHQDQTEARSPEALERHYRALGTLVMVPLSVSLAIALGIQLGAEGLYEWLWSAHDPRIVPLVQTLGWSLPLLVLVQVPAEATRASLHFGFAIGIVQVAFPLLSVLSAVALYYTVSPSILAVAQGTLLALGLCIPASLYAYAKHFDLGRTFRSAFGFRWDREVLSFAFPQSLNMMLNQGLVRLDSLMLSFFGVSANAIGVYSLVSDLTQVVRLAKMAFSGVFSPLVAKYRAEKNKRGVIEALERFARKTSSLGMLLFLVVLCLWPAFIFKPGETWNDSAFFPWLLCAGPMMSCFFGLCGNALLMYGHSRVLLLNAMAAGLINLILNALFIPIWGLFGAALATAISNVTISVLQIVELKRLESIGVQASYYLRTLAAATPSIVAVAFFTLFSWPVTSTPFDVPNWVMRTGLATISALTYLALLWFLPGTRPLSFGSRRS